MNLKPILIFFLRQKPLLSPTCGLTLTFCTKSLRLDHGSTGRPRMCLLDRDGHDKTQGQNRHSVRPAGCTMPERGGPVDAKTASITRQAQSQFPHRSSASLSASPSKRDGREPSRPNQCSLQEKPCDPGEGAASISGFFSKSFHI